MLEIGTNAHGYENGKEGQTGHLTKRCAEDPPCPTGFRVKGKRRAHSSPRGSALMEGKCMMNGIKDTVVVYKLLLALPFLQQNSNFASDTPQPAGN